MQTFLPYPSFTSSAACLDRQRLGKQRAEALQILISLTEGGGWSNHPATKMWRGHTLSLAVYGLTMCVEWRKRGYVDNTSRRFRTFLSQNPGEIIRPRWIGDNAFHASHRAALLAKLPSHYSQFGWTETPGIAYVWPTNVDQSPA